jgi:ATP-dependent exoDNAse (exonuclease V) beta subunit
VTFTNKAANEMKERLIEIQKEIAESSSNIEANFYEKKQESLDFDEMVFGEDDIDSYLNEYEQSYPS